MAKATKKEMYLRELEIQEMMAEGKTRTQIYEECSKRWGVAEKTVESQYYKIVASMEALVLEGREELRTILMARNDLIFQRALKDNSLKVALDANMAQAKIGTLFEPKKDTVKSSKSIVIKEREPTLELISDKAENE